MKYLRNLIGISKLGKERINVLGKKGRKSWVKKINQYQGKWLQHVRGWTKENTKTSNKIPTKRTKEHWKTKEEMEGSTLS